MDRNQQYRSSARAQTACVRSHRGSTHGLHPTPYVGLPTPASTHTVDGTDELCGNVEPHRPPQVHLLVDSMESTGVYWTPVWNVLERGSWKFDLVLVNPQHVRALQGEKTDVKDCRRLAELGQHDLLRSSFIPPPPIRELRDLTRRRSQLQQDRNRVVCRIGRLLETANIKLGSVASDIVGKTGWLILNAIAQGEKDPKQLAERAQGSLQGKKAELAEALRGYTSEHFRWQLRELLEDVSRLDHKVKEIDSRLRQKDGTPPGSDPALVHDSRCQGDRRLDSDCRTWNGHDSVPHSQTCRQLGRVVSGQLRERGQTAVRAYAQGGSISTPHADPEWLGGFPQEGLLSLSLVLACCLAAGSQARCHGRRSSGAGDCVLHHPGWDGVSRTRRRSL